MNFLAENKIIVMVVLLGVLVCGCSTRNKAIPDVSMHNLPPTYEGLDNAYWWRASLKMFGLLMSVLTLW